MGGVPSTTPGTTRKLVTGTSNPSHDLSKLNETQKGQYFQLATGSEKEAFYKQATSGTQTQPAPTKTNGFTEQQASGINAASQTLSSLNTAYQQTLVDRSNSKKADQQQLANSINTGIDSAFASMGPVGQIISMVSGTTRSIGQSVRADVEKDANGDGVPDKSRESVENAAVWGGILSPWDTLSYRIQSGDWTSVDGKKYYDYMFGDQARAKQQDLVHNSMYDPNYVAKQSAAEGGYIKGKKRPNMIAQKLESGGPVIGPGGPKDDLVETEEIEGSFVADAEHAELAAQYRAKYLT